jgi:hypothetical protein
LRSNDRRRADGFERPSAVAGLGQQRDGLALTHAPNPGVCGLVPGVVVSVFEVFARPSLDGPAHSASEPAIVVGRFDDSGRRGERRVDRADRALQAARDAGRHRLG